MVTKVHSFRGLGSSLQLLQDVVSCGFRTEVPSFLLVVSQGLISGARGHLQFLTLPQPFPQHDS